MSLREDFNKKIAPQLKEELGFKNIFDSPRVEKIVVNSGTGKIAKEEETVKFIEECLKMITGQKPVKTLAKKSISTFKVRKGMPIGLKVTLRGNRMYDFLEKLIKITLPRVRDFQGLKKESVDVNGNLVIGIREQAYFPEISADMLDRTFGLEVSVVANAKNRNEAILLYKKLGIPFKAD